MYICLGTWSTVAAAARTPSGINRAAAVGQRRPTRYSNVTSTSTSVNRTRRFSEAKASGDCQESSAEVFLRSAAEDLGLFSDKERLQNGFGSYMFDFNHKLMFSKQVFIGLASILVSNLGSKIKKNL